MKRLWKDGSSISQPKKLVVLSPLTKHKGQPEIKSGGEHRLTVNDGLTYVNLVKEVFRDKKEKYHGFLEAMKDFKAKRIDTIGVIAKVKELFKGHKDLILRFNIFLPNEYEIKLPLEDEQPPLEKPNEFAQKEVEKCLTSADNNHRRCGAKEKKPIEDSSVFESPLKSDYINTSGKKKSRDDANTSSQLKQPVMLTSEKKHISQTQISSGDDQRLIINVLAYIKTIKEVFSDKTEKYHDFLEVMWDFKAQSCRVQDSGANHDTDENVGIQPSSSVVEDISSMKSMFSGVFGYLEEATERLRNPDDFKEFLKYIRIYSKELITQEELKLLVGNLFGQYADLMEGFNEFLS
ncbi:paired amphipathic helix protein Sin3-like 3 [Phaseolus vulgaris]|uniref:paired amphipathic helix protein Sin3-like 3 n=1 Tax=Phaseolus vulgaris TaxID=3885 RepID=UPI0035CAD1FB